MFTERMLLEWFNVFPTNIEQVIISYSKLKQEDLRGHKHYFSKKLRFELELYYYRPGLISRKTKNEEQVADKVFAGFKILQLLLKQEKPLPSSLQVNSWDFTKYTF